MEDDPLIHRLPAGVLHRCWSGKYQQDSLYGHKLGVRCMKLLPSHNLLATGSMDKTVRLWDLAAGMPISASRPHGGIVRSIAIDSEALFSGSSDHTIRVWQAAAATAVADSHGTGPLPLVPHFDLMAAPQAVRGHRGPVACLALTERCLYSGSWDYTVRAWSRSGEGGALELAGIFSYDDWVSSVAARGRNLLVSAGPQVLVQDLSTGQVVRKFTGLHEGHVTCLEGTHNGRMLFTGSSDGLVLAHDLRMRHPTVVLWHHNAEVHGLALEDPWLVSASSDGTVMLLNTETQLGATSRGLGANCRQLMAPGGAAYCVDLSEQWLACGAEAETVRVWDFSKAAEAAARAAAARAGRNTRKSRRALQLSPGPPAAPLIAVGEPEHLLASAMPAPHSSAHTKGRRRAAASSGFGIASVGLVAAALEGCTAAACEGPNTVQSADVVLLTEALGGDNSDIAVASISRSARCDQERQRQRAIGASGERKHRMRSFAAPPPPPPPRPGGCQRVGRGGALGGTGRSSTMSCPASLASQDGFWYASIGRGCNANNRTNGHVVKPGSGGSRG